MMYNFTWLKIMGTRILIIRGLLEVTLFWALVSFWELIGKVIVDQSTHF